MKQIWKCDFCDETGTQQEMEKHELTCHFKPGVKNCVDCKYMYDGGSPYFGSFDECEKGLSCFDYDEMELDCPKWEYTDENQFLKDEKEK